MTERADILRLQAELKGIPATPSGCCFWRGIRGEDKNSPRRVGKAESVILAAIFFIPATYIVGKFLGVW